MTRRVVVIGGGASGTAAAHAAVKVGARVTMIIGGPGSTSLSSGALDGDVGAVAVEARAFVEALGIWALGDCRVATSSGLLRSTEGRDLSVLDLHQVAPGTIGVLDVRRRGWDAAGLARSWTGEPWAIERGLRFEAVAVEALRHADEDVIPLADLAARHDDPERVSWVADRLRESKLLSDKCAVVMGPWLGLRPEVASVLTRALGKPVGEPLSTPGVAAGLRFERARDALLTRLAIGRFDEWAASVQGEEGDARVTLASGKVVTADAVVMALGGLTAGGIEWSPATAPCGFKTSLDQPGSVALRGKMLDPSGSPAGAVFEKFSWSGGSAPTGMERVGIWTDRDGRARNADGIPATWLYAAGDIVADAPRRLLESIRAGIVAGARAGRPS